MSIGTRFNLLLQAVTTRQCWVAVFFCLVSTTTVASHHDSVSRNLNPDYQLAHIETFRYEYDDQMNLLEKVLIESMEVELDHDKRTITFYNTLRPDQPLQMVEHYNESGEISLRQHFGDDGAITVEQRYIRDQGRLHKIKTTNFFNPDYSSVQQYFYNTKGQAIRTVTQYKGLSGFDSANFFYNIRDQLTKATLTDRRRPNVPGTTLNRWNSQRQLIHTRTLYEGINEGSYSEAVFRYDAEGNLIGHDFLHREKISLSNNFRYEKLDKPFFKVQK